MYELYTCYDSNCLISPKNTCTYWEIIRSDYMLGITGNRIFWANSEKPNGPLTIQKSEKEKLEKDVCDV